MHAVRVPLMLVPHGVCIHGSYAGMPISEVFEADIGLGGVLSLLWFRRRLPDYATKFIEMILMVRSHGFPVVKKSCVRLAS